jgi:hypothetical protein
LIAWIVIEAASPLERHSMRGNGGVDTTGSE